MFSQKLPLATLISWSRALRHGVDIGLPLPRIFRQQAKSGPAAARPLAEALAERLAGGDTLAAALAPEAGRYPLLMLELVRIGEETGRLTEAFVALEDYLGTLARGRRQFLAALVWPAMSYCGAILVIALMLLILGLLAPSDGKGFDPLGLGLLGPTGALIFVGVMATLTASAVVTFLKVRDSDALRSRFEAFALKLPVLAGCFQAFALQRFSLGLHMATEAGMRPERALKLSLAATANRAYAQHAGAAARMARGGEEFAPTLAALGPTLFPQDFLDSVQVGEVSGRLPEVLAQEERRYRDLATRKLLTLTMLTSAAVYAMVGLLIIVVIVRLLMSIAGVYQDAMKGL